jgi:hypothetical protein
MLTLSLDAMNVWGSGEADDYTGVIAQAPRIDVFSSFTQGGP